MTIPPTLREVLNKYTFIENIFELCIVVTHDYLIKHNYVLIKDGQVGESFVLAEIYLYFFKKTIDLTQIWTKPMTSIKSIYDKQNFNSLQLEMFRTANDTTLICYFNVR
jgi:hypothetical protein